MAGYAELELGEDVTTPISYCDNNMDQNANKNLRFKTQANESLDCRHNEERCGPERLEKVKLGSLGSAHATARGQALSASKSLIAHVHVIGIGRLSIATLLVGIGGVVLCVVIGVCAGGVCISAGLRVLFVVLTSLLCEAGVGAQEGLSRLKSVSHDGQCCDSNRESAVDLGGGRRAQGSAGRGRMA